MKKDQRRAMKNYVREFYYIKHEDAPQTEEFHLTVNGIINTQEIEKFPSFENYKLSANSLMVINAPDEAAEYYKKALKIKNDLEVMRDLGRALVKTHDYHEASEYYLEASKLDERNINNQTVVYYWQMMEDYIELMYLLARNTEGNIEEKIEKCFTLKDEIEKNTMSIIFYP